MSCVAYFKIIQTRAHTSTSCICMVQMAVYRTTIETLLGTERVRNEQKESAREAQQNETTRRNQIISQVAKEDSPAALVERYGRKKSWLGNEDPVRMPNNCLHDHS